MATHFHDEYTGPRWTYGLLHRPISAYFIGSCGSGDLPHPILFSHRPSRDPRFRLHGEADWPCELPPDVARHHSPVLVSAPRTMVVHVNDAGGYDVYIGRAVRRRGFEGSKWGNPFPLAMGTREQVIEAFRRHLLESPDLLAALPELKGKRLGCWCKPKACHGDVLAELADGHC